MLNVGKKFRAVRDNKNKYCNSRVVRKNISERKKTITPPPPCKLNGRSLSNIWENQGNFNPKWHSLSLKQKLFDQFQQKWRSNMNNSSKGLCCKKN